MFGIIVALRDRAGRRIRSAGVGGHHGWYGYGGARHVHRASTTIPPSPAIVYFGYFYLVDWDVQTNLISTVEQITGNHFMPRFHIQTETVLHQFADLIRSLAEPAGSDETHNDPKEELAAEMRTQSAFEDLETRIIPALVDVHRTRIQPVNEEINDTSGCCGSVFARLEEP